ncbi:MAG: CHC2 zinc finger domain-containing protein, partial [Mariniphaga sp.]
MIPKELEQAIKSEAKIYDIIREYVSLERAGVNYKGKCPFHSEDTPSFIVSPVKGIYKCFGCGVHGDTVWFVKEYERISYPEALKRVGKICHIEVPDREFSPDELSAFKRKEGLLDNLVKENAGFKHHLEKNQQALQWLSDKRGISPE